MALGIVTSSNLETDAQVLERRTRPRRLHPERPVSQVVPALATSIFSCHQDVAKLASRTDHRGRAQKTEHRSPEAATRSVEVMLISRSCRRLSPAVCPDAPGSAARSASTFGCGCAVSKGKNARIQAERSVGMTASQQMARADVIAVGRMCSRRRRNAKRRRVFAGDPGQELWKTRIPCLSHVASRCARPLTTILHDGPTRTAAPKPTTRPRIQGGRRRRCSRCQRLTAASRFPAPRLPLATLCRRTSPRRSFGRRPLR